MTAFNVTVITPDDHQFAHVLYDWARCIEWAITELGYDCYLTHNNMEKDRLNLILGAHHIRQMPAFEGEYVVVNTELIDGRGLVNHNIHDEYIEFMKGAKWVWDEVAKNAPHIEKYTGHKPLNYTGGYVPIMEECPLRKPKDIDMMFFGSVTIKRAQYIRHLHDLGCEVFTMFNFPEVFRNDLIARSRVHLAPCHDLPRGHASIQRLCYLLNNRQAVVSEESSDHVELAKLGWYVPSEDFVDTCVEVLKSYDTLETKSKITQAYVTFKEKYPFTAQIRSLLDRMEIK